MRSKIQLARVIEVAPMMSFDVFVSYSKVDRATAGVKEKVGDVADTIKDHLPGDK